MDKTSVVMVSLMVLLSIPMFYLIFKINKLLDEISSDMLIADENFKVKIEIMKNNNLINYYEKKSNYLKYLYDNAIVNSSRLDENVNYLRGKVRIMVLPENIQLGKYSLTWIDVCRYNNISNGNAVIDPDGYYFCGGWTDNKGSISLLNNLSTSEHIKNCNHEVLHNMINIENLEIEEEVIQQIEGYAMTRECAMLATEFGKE